MMDESAEGEFYNSAGLPPRGMRVLPSRSMGEREGEDIV